MSQPTAAPPFLREEAYTWIRDRILRGEFAPGEPLNRRKLAAQLRMSLLPVSEAFRKLELAGLIETQVRAGSRVRMPSMEDVEDFVVIRVALECEAARLFCERASAQDRSELLQRAQQLDRLRAGSGKLAYDVTRDRDLAYAIQSYHVEFHLRVVDAGRCRALRRLMEEKHVLTMHWLYEVVAGSVAPLDSHVDLARILVGKDAERAALAMREHIGRGSADLLARFRARREKEQETCASEPSAPRTPRRWRDVTKAKPVVA
jgi:DNA-binding GntR family transcriptional regulator